MHGLIHLDFSFFSFLYFHIQYIKIQYEFHTSLGRWGPICGQMTRELVLALEGCKFQFCALDNLKLGSVESHCAHQENPNCQSISYQNAETISDVLYRVANIQPDIFTICSRRVFVRTKFLERHTRQRELAQESLAIVLGDNISLIAVREFSAETRAHSHVSWR